MKNLFERAEYTMMTGRVVSVQSNEEAEEMVRYIERCVNGDDAFTIVETVCKYNPNTVTGLCVQTVQDMPCVTLVLQSAYPTGHENWYPEPFEEDYGCGYPCAFCYVYNLEVPYFSEFEDCFFEETSTGYRRIS